MQFRCGSVGLTGGVDTAETAQRPVIEALRAERHTVHAGGGVLGETPALDRAGVRLHRDLGVRCER